MANIQRNYLTQNPCFKQGRTLKPQGIMLHSVGVNQPKASVFLKTWNSPSYDRACVHGFIDAETGVVYQTLPWTTRGWHCGGAGNNTHIGIEMCEPADIHYTQGAKFSVTDLVAAQEQAKRTYQSAVELFAYICKNLGLNPLADGVVISHAEGYKRGIATNHADPQHLWSGLNLPYTMDTFRQAVKEEMANQNGSQGSVPFLVRVDIEDLNIRKGPGTNYGTANKFTGKGVFTIVEVQGNWGLLKAYQENRDGWISLKYATRV